MAREAFSLYAFLIFSLARSSTASAAAPPYESNTSSTAPSTSGRRMQTTCVCSGQSNNYDGSPECNTFYNGAPFCYVNPGACLDGTPSESLSEQDWSYMACQGADRPRPTKGDIACVQQVLDDNPACRKYVGRSGTIVVDDSSYHPYQIENFVVGENGEDEGSLCWFREAFVTKGHCSDCSSGCKSDMLGDDKCDPSCRNSACNYDYGDCPTPCTADADCAYLSGTACMSGYCRECGSFTTEGTCPSDKCMWSGFQCQAPPCQCNHEGRQEASDQSLKGGDFCWLSAPRSPSHCQLLSGNVVTFKWVRCEFNGVSQVNCDEAICHAETVESCDSIHHKDRCLNSLDGQYFPASPCVWCSGASNCGGNDCLPLGLVNFEADDTQPITCQALRCPKNFPVCDEHGDCVSQACSSGECSWSQGENFISGYDEKGTLCGGDYQVIQPPTYRLLPKSPPAQESESALSEFPDLVKEIETAGENRQRENRQQPPPCRRLSLHRRRVNVRGASGASGSQVDCYDYEDTKSHALPCSPTAWLLASSAALVCALGALQS